MPARRGTRAPVAPVEELEEIDEVEELELEEEPEELESESKPAARGRGKATKAAPAKAPAKKAPAKPAARRAPVEEEEEADTGFDSNWLAEYVNETQGTDYDSRAIRMVLRKLAKDEVIEREIGVDRSRYTFSGPDDPRVKAVLRSVRSGTVETEKAAGVEKAKATRAAKAPAKAAAPAKATTRKAAPAKATRRRAPAPAVEEEEED